MKKREYYSVRTGKILPDEQVDFDIVKRLFQIAYKKLYTDGYFQKYFGIDCTDGYREGLLGDDIEVVMFVNLKKGNLYPVIPNLSKYSEDDLFDVLEFLHDHCSKGINGYYHSWNECGFHYEEYDDLEGQRQFREMINPILKDYQCGFEISENGQILMLSDNGLGNLFNAEIPCDDENNIRNRINAAILKFRRYKSSMNERREAVRELADVLEFLRPAIKDCLHKQDESDIFNIANKFGIRHHNLDQKTNYDQAIWYSWIFYFYLATLHAVLRMIEKNAIPAQSLKN